MEYEEENAEREEKIEEENSEEEVYATISLCTKGDAKSSTTLVFQGQIGKTPIVIFVDGGSTHSFICPSLVQTLNLSSQTTKPMLVRVENGARMTSTVICSQLKFQLQNTKFETDFIVLDVPGCDVILGVDWLSKFGPVTIDYLEGNMRFNYKGKTVFFQMEEVTAKVKLCNQTIDIQKEKKKGSQVVIAHLFNMEVEGSKEEAQPPLPLQPVLEEYVVLFQEPTELPPAREIDHKIPLKDANQVVNLKPYRFSYFQRLEIEKIVEELLANSFISPSTSPYSSPVLLVKKKDNTSRMCVDFRKLNDNTIKNKFPIPVIDDLLDELKHATVFSKLDLKAGYHQIRMCEGDKHKTAFKTNDGLYEFNVMPFGLTNAPATFQALMNTIFKPYLRKFILVFFDDILIYSQDHVSHVEHLKKAFQILKENQLYVKKSKCKFGVESIEYLGFVIAKGGVATDKKKIEAMVN